ncbi:MAG: SPOR domain-containing protein [Bacteroidales bacterium]|nr:SPOR domain-containing protein [Bacteroidales bacterium]MBN2818091.1 SPOR domain-containing protein [Bacteroidales bacterium]
MIRLFAPYANLLVAVVLKILFQGDVGVNISAPTEVVAGNEFQVQVTINKGDLSAFSRLLQDLPAGLTAKSIETSNADFDFSDKRARFIWLRMPDEEQFTVSYKIKVDPRLKGTFSIGGKFSYIEENERRSVNVQSNNITILPSPNIDPSLIVDIADFERLVIPYIAPAGSDPQIACIRQAPKLQADGKSYIVNILVSKERKEKFAKIEENIPNGYVAEVINERDAIFTSKNRTAKFLWMNLPASSFFLVSYKLTPTNSSVRAPMLFGKFSYLEEAKTVSIDIKQTGQELAQISTAEELSNLLANIDNEQLAYNTTETNTGSEVTEKPITVKSQTKNNTKYKLEPEEGIYYRVQLAAGHDPVNIKRYFKKYKLDKEVRIEIHEGWHKYSIGSFQSYKEARDYRVHVWNTTIIDDAFVSAYNNGNRITVQEALMVANQKWYK